MLEFCDELLVFNDKFSYFYYGNANYTKNIYHG
jgi:hypothetical protein